MDLTLNKVTITPLLTLSYSIVNHILTAVSVIYYAKSNNILTPL